MLFKRTTALRQATTNNHASIGLQTKERNTVMKTKLVLWGKKAQDESETPERVLMAMELNPETNKVKTWLFEGEHANDDLAQALMDKWRQGEAIALPTEVEPTESALSAGTSLLPEGIEAEKKELITRTQTEWIFIVLSTKLFKNYRTELEELQEQIETATQYSKEQWNRMKSFWEKVQQQINEQNLFKEHISVLRTRTNELFAQLKRMRSAEDAEFEAHAKEQYANLLAKLEPLENAVGTEGTDLQKLFNQLKDLQQEFKALQLTRSLRSKLWDRIDNAFKIIKKKRSPNGSPEGRLTRRMEGLKSAIEKMERSIARDQKEMDVQQKKINSGKVTQLETQLRQVRAQLIQERIDSKNKKLLDMRNTMSDLEKKQERNLKRQAREVAKEKKKQEETAKKAAAKQEKEPQEQPPVVEAPKEEPAPEADAPAVDSTEAKPTTEETAEAPSKEAEPSDEVPKKEAPAPQEEAPASESEDTSSGDEEE